MSVETEMAAARSLIAGLKKTRDRLLERYAWDTLDDNDKRLISELKETRDLAMARYKECFGEDYKP